MSDSPNEWIAKRVEQLAGTSPLPAHRLDALVRQATDDWNRHLTTLDDDDRRVLDAWFALSLAAMIDGDDSRLDELDAALARFEPLAVMHRAAVHLRSWDATGVVPYEQVRGALKQLGADATTLRITAAVVNRRGDGDAATTDAVLVATARHGGRVVFDALLFALDAVACTAAVGAAGTDPLGLGAPHPPDLQARTDGKVGARRRQDPVPRLSTSTLAAFAAAVGSDDPIDIERWLDERVRQARHSDGPRDALPAVAEHLVEWAEAKLAQDQPAAERAIVSLQFEYTPSTCSAASLVLVATLAGRWSPALMGGLTPDEAIHQLVSSMWGEADAIRRSELVRVATTGRGSVAPATLLADAFDVCLLLALAMEQRTGTAATSTLAALVEPV